MKTIFRLKMMEGKNLIRQEDCNEFEELKKFQMVFKGKPTEDEYPEIFAVGNHLKYRDSDEIYKITKLRTQNGILETLVDVDCQKL